MKSTSNHFTSMYEAVRLQHADDQTFSNLIEICSLKRIQRYLQESSQKEFNYYALLEMKGFLSRCELSPNVKQRYYRLIKIVFDFNYLKEDNPLQADFINKYHSYTAYMAEKNYSKSTIQVQKNNCTHVQRALVMIDSTVFNADVCTKLIAIFEHLIEENTLTRKNARIFQRLLQAVLEQSITGTVSVKYGSGRLRFPIKESLSEIINKYLYKKLHVDHLCETTLAERRVSIERFAKQLGDSGCNCWSTISRKEIIEHCNTLGFMTKAQLKNTLSAIRGFLRFLHEQNLSKSDLSAVVPKCSYRAKVHLPSMYTSTEIQQILDGIDRSNTKGKRDYCMILIVCRLGLRAGDVCGLTCKDIDWDNNCIRIIQNKTKNPLTLSLPVDVGNAIISYLTVRPQSENLCIFLKLIAPWEGLSRPTFHSIVSERMRNAGIPIKNRKHGPHALRHSLAGKLMEKHIPLTVISDLLGHVNYSTTADYYLSSNLAQLRECALDVVFDTEQEVSI